jgi:hypothetical protein
LNKLFFLVVGRGFGIAQTKRICLNGKIILQNLIGTTVTVTFGEKKNRKIIKKTSQSAF